MEALNDPATTLLKRWVQYCLDNPSAPVPHALLADTGKVLNQRDPGYIRALFDEEMRTLTMLRDAGVLLDEQEART